MQSSAIQTDWTKDCRKSGRCSSAPYQRSVKPCGGNATNGVSDTLAPITATRGASRKATASQATASVVRRNISRAPAGPAAPPARR